MKYWKNKCNSDPSLRLPGFYTPSFRSTHSSNLCKHISVGTWAGNPHNACLFLALICVAVHLNPRTLSFNVAASQPSLQLSVFKTASSSWLHVWTETTIKFILRYVPISASVWRRPHISSFTSVKLEAFKSRLLLQTLGLTKVQVHLTPFTRAY